MAKVDKGFFILAVLGVVIEPAWPPAIFAASFGLGWLALPILFGSGPK